MIIARSPKPGEVEIVIHDSMGQRVVQLSRGEIVNCFDVFANAVGELARNKLPQAWRDDT